MGYPCPPYNAITQNADGTRQDFYGPPSVAGDRSHGGDDFPAPSGTDARAPMTGIVTTADGVGLSTAGKYICIDRDGWRVRILHLQRTDVFVGDVVTQGQVIGATDNTGLSTGPHVHMDVSAETEELALTVQPDPMPHLGRWAVDPEKLLTNEEDEMAKEILAVPGVHGGYTFVLTGDGELRWLKSADERDYLMAHGYTQRTETDGRVMSMLDSENGETLTDNLKNGRYG